MDRRSTLSVTAHFIAALCCLVLISSQLSAVSPDDVRRDFEAVQKLNTYEAYEAFLKQYPDGLYAGLAREELKKLALKEVRELIRAINFELARVGCAVNAGGDEWTAESEEAIARFNEHAKTKLNPSEFGASLLNVLREKTQRVCPLVCGPNQRAQGEACVAVAPPPTKTAPPDAKQTAPKGKSWCLRDYAGSIQCGFATHEQCLASKTSGQRGSCVQQN